MKRLNPYRNLTLRVVENLSYGMELCAVAGKSTANVAIADVEALLRCFDKSNICGIWPKQMKSRSQAASLLLKSKLCSLPGVLHEEEQSYWIESDQPIQHLDLLFSRDVLYREVSFFVAMSDEKFVISALLDDKTIIESSRFYGFSPSATYIREAAARGIATMYASGSNRNDLLLMKQKQGSEHN